MGLQFFLTGAIKKAVCGGKVDHELTAIELSTGKKVSVESVPQSWFGLAADKNVSRLWWSGGDALLFNRRGNHQGVFRNID